jgi:PrtD family type I secretion system ABC transporter
MSQTLDAAGARRNPLAAALAGCRGALIGVAAFSCIGNVLMLTGSLYMMEVYDRVLPSRSIPTLIGLSVLALLLFGFQGVFDAMRARLLVRIAAVLDGEVAERVFSAMLRMKRQSGARSDGMLAVRDLDAARGFISGPGPGALFDLPWMPLYLAVCFAFHFWLGMTAVAGACILLVITIATDRLSRAPVTAATQASAARARVAEAAHRNAEVLGAMAMEGPVRRQWFARHREMMGAQARSADIAGGLGAAGRVLRMVLQSSLLCVGALLVIRQEASAGIIIAGSIIGGRALAPVDSAIANWRGFIAARQSWGRLGRLLDQKVGDEARTLLPPPHKGLRVEAASAIPPGGDKSVLMDVDLALVAGNGLGVIGPSASGKSSLARMLVGIWRPVRGAVRLDGAELSQWAPEELGKHIGYLPQDVELFAGTIAENIARFDEDATDTAVIAAARAARVHEMIVGLPNGYETELGDAGMLLSAGQRQRIALARALYGEPFLVVLDEPNSNLDSDGEAALTQAIVDIRARGGIAVVIAHRPSALAGVDLVLVMQQGRALAFGPKDEVLAKVLRRENAPGNPVALKPMALAGKGNG